MVQLPRLLSVRRFSSTCRLSLPLAQRASPVNGGSRPPPRRHQNEPARTTEHQPRLRRAGPVARRIFPAQAQTFINRETGFMETTAENHDWLLRTRITHDVGNMYSLNDKRLSALTSKFACSLYYSPEQVIHPKDVLHLSPRGSPWAPEFRTRYEMKMQKESLWINVTCSGGQPVVAHMIKRRLKGSLHRALQATDRYDEFGNAEKPGGGRVRGTVAIHIYNILKGIDLDSREFGETVLSAVERESKRIYENEKRK